MGAFEWKDAREGPVGQLGKAQAMMEPEDEEALREEYESNGVEGDGQPIEMGDEVAEELGGESKSMLGMLVKT